MALNFRAQAGLAAVLLLFGLVVPALAQQRQPSLFTVANVRVQADAANAVEAKNAATQKAQMLAWRTLVGRLVDFRVQSRIPDPAPEQLERIISGIDVRNEGFSGTSYVATFGITFSERAAQAHFSQFGVFPILDRGPEILIVPVYIEGGAARTTDRNPWRSALTQLDLTHALVPAKVAPVRSDLTAPIANAYFANPAATAETLKSQYHTTQVLLAVAEIDAGDAISLRLIGYDSLGLFNLQRKLKTKDGVDEPLMQSAARLALETVEQRWKLTRGGAETASADASSPGEAPGFSAAGPVSLQVTAQFSGLKEWQAIRSRLEKMPGVQNWDLKGVNPRSALISFSFPGGAERLTAMAAAQGLSVENGPEGLVVKTR
jgi:hypothetical protein